jgi:hypothetical protein
MVKGLSLQMNNHLDQILEDMSLSPSEYKDLFLDIMKVNRYE